MGEWNPIVPHVNGLYFYRPYPEMPSAVVVRTNDGFLFPGIERFVSPGDMLGEFWSEPIEEPPA